MLIMKKISLFLMGIVSAFTLSAQTKPHLAVKGGLNIASLNLENNENTDSKLGVHLGLTAHVHLARQWAVQPELLYSQEGGTLTRINGNNKVKVKNDYINVPLMLQYMFDNGFRIEAGPQIGFLVSSKLKDQNGEEENSKDDFKTTNASLGFGLNYLSYSGLGVGGRYNLGLSDVTTGPGKGTQNNFQISLFYMLDPSHKAKSR
ncbi:PorT family protein [Paracnuella aquatica]|nr:PorT family protein [Paracnuella aquatica]